MRKVGEVAHACIFISTKHITSSFIHKYTQTMPTLKHIRQDASVAMTPAVMPAQQPAPALAPSSEPSALSSAPVPAPDPSPAPKPAHPPATKYQKNAVNAHKVTGNAFLNLPPIFNALSASRCTSGEYSKTAEKVCPPILRKGI